jgi:hypothetical protein
MGKYQRVIEALKQNEDAIDAHVEMLSILYDLTPEEVMNMPLEQYQELSFNCSFLMQPLPPVKGRICKEYKFGDMVLVPTTDIKKFSAAQYIDYQQMIQEDGKLIELMSCLLVPKGCKYAQGYDIADVHKVIAEYMCVSDVMEMSAFFLRKLKNSISNTLSCLELDMTLSRDKDKRRMINLSRIIRHSLKNGVGLTMSVK